MTGDALDVPTQAPRWPAHADVGVLRGQALSVIIPVLADSWKLRLVQWSIAQTADLPFEVVAARAPQCVAANRNAGLDRARHDLVAFVDDDVVLPPFWMSRLVAVLAARPDAGAVGARLVGLWGEPQTRPDVGEGDVVAAMIPGTCFVYSRRRVGDERFDAAYLGSQWEDTDWMMRVRARGLSTLVSGSVSVLHANELTRNQWFEVNRQRFVARWGEPQS